MILKVNKRAFAFFMYFLPLFALKLLDITTEEAILKIVGVISFLIFVVHALQEKYSTRLLNIFSILVIYAFILILTCGKQGILFSIVMVMAMKGIDVNKDVYKVCFLVGCVFLVIGCYLSKDGAETMRYMNGEWVLMIKRNNLLYVSFIAVVSLYLLIHRDKLRIRNIMYVFIVGYLMYLYIGSRTGLVSTFFLVAMLLAFHWKSVRDSKFVKCLCVCSPLYCMAFSIFSGIGYGKYDILTILDMMLQGRITQNNAYMNRYGITLFGQPIYEGDSNGDFWNLDCAYLDMLISEGLIFAIFWIVVTMKVITYMYNHNKMLEVALLVMYAFYGISETFLPNCFLNMSLFLYGEYLYATFGVRKQRLLYNNT